MHAVCETVRRVAPTDAPILIFGEAGCGKSTIAKAIHDASLRKGKPFARVNCAAAQQGTLADQLFGAQDQSGWPGAFVEALKGSLFMEELETLPRDVQNKLDGVLQEKKLIKHGVKTDEPLDTRLIAATTKQLEALLQEGNFNRSLFFRLKGIQIEVKPLRERREDIIPLALHILKSTSTDGKLPALSQEVRELFARYSWPGNATELQTAIEYAVKAANGKDTIGKDCLPAEMVASVKATPAISDADSHRGEKLKEFLQKKLGT
jgi:DNA-binding NtrC family response regulator